MHFDGVSVAGQAPVVAIRAWSSIRVSPTEISAACLPQYNAVSEFLKDFHTCIPARRACVRTVHTESISYNLWRCDTQQRHLTLRRQHCASVCSMPFVVLTSRHARRRAWKPPVRCHCLCCYAQSRRPEQNGQNISKTLVLSCQVIQTAFGLYSSIATNNDWP